MRTRLPICLLLAALCLLPGENTARGDLIILKDGFVLRGTVRRQSTTAFDPVGGMMEFAKIDGFFWVEDGCRRMIFSHRQVHEEGVEDKDRYRESDQVRLTKPFSRLDNFRLQPGSVPAEITDFDAKWERVFKIDAPTGRINIPQRLVALSPDFVRVESLRYFWAPCYLTSEFSVEKLRKLLSDHPDLKPTGKANDDVARRFRAARFFLQAKHYDDAEREYQSIAKDFPDQQEKIEASRDNLRKLRQMQGLDDLERAQKAGRHNWVQEQLAAWPTQGLDERSLGRVQSLKTIYDSTQPNVAQARRYLKELPGRLTSPGTRQLLTEAATAILDELTLENVGRLEAFLNQARLVEKKPTAEGDQGPEALLSLAVTGWLLGNNSAEKKLDTALRLWRARELVLDYQRTSKPEARKRMATLLQQSGVAFDELAQVIRYSPPPEPYPLLATQWPVIAGCILNGGGVAAGHCPGTIAPWPLAAAHLPGRALGAVTLRLSTDTLPPELTLTRRRGIGYHLQLPPEYHHGRAFPLLIALHAAGEGPQEMLKRLAPLAAAHGYLLATPEWGSGFRHAYDYTAEEHASVLDVLRDLRRRFQVDSDRVFLFGAGEGGNMAYDVGLSHPDLFAGVIPMAAKPRYFAKLYWKNAQHLPLFVIDGDRNGDSASDNRRQFQHWVRAGYPALYIEYKGRSLEWFSGELSYVFDWMSRQKRGTALPEIGRGAGGILSEEFQALRPTDDHFYWLSVSGLGDRNTNEAGRWRVSVVPGSLTGRIGEGNQINVTAHGFRRVTVWLGQGMIDFDKNVKILVNLQPRWINRKVSPDLTTLLEDFYERGDRQRLFWAKVEFTL